MSRFVGGFARFSVACGVVTGAVVAVSAPVGALSKGPPGHGTVVVSPSQVLAASSANTLLFTYTAARAGTDAGKVRLVVPKGWTAPQKTDPGGPGYVSASSGSIGVFGSLITVRRLTLCGGCSVRVGYARASAPATGVTSTFEADAATVPAPPRRLRHSPSVVVATLPSAPTIVSVEPGNEQLTVTFTAATAYPAVTRYDVTCGSETAATPDVTPVTVTGLPNGHPAPCTVTATNSAGPGPASTAVDGTPAPQVPGAPTITVSPGDGELLVQASTAQDNGDPVLSYTATCGSQSATAANAAPAVTVTGLTNGTPYSCTAVATNAVGSGPPSAPVSGTPAIVVPGAPVVTTVTPGEGSLTVAYGAADGFGAPIKSYTATCGSQSTTVDGDTLSITVSGLTVDALYTDCSVVATDAAGDGPAAGFSARAGPPEAPTVTAVVGQDGQVTVVFDPVIGNDWVTSYTATCGSQSATVNGETAWATVTGLPNGDPTSCTVVATNAAGSGPPSAPTAATPQAPASSPTPSAGGAFEAVSCPTTSFCVAVGADADGTTGLVEVSTDGGESFVDEPVPAGTDPLVGVSCVDDSHCVAVGGTTVLVSNDGGAEWEAEYAQAGLSGVTCLSETLCMAGSATDELFGGWTGTPVFTTDGGVTWQSATSVLDFDPLMSISCTADVCIGVGPTPFAYSSSDDGMTWQLLSFGSVIGDVLNVACLPTTTTCLAVGSVLFGTYPVAFISTDDGADWSDVSAAFPAGEFSLRDLACPTATVCYAFGGPYTTGGPLLGAVTTDAGVTWSPVTGPTKAPPDFFDPYGDGIAANQLSCAAASTCVIVGKGSAGPTASVTTDGSVSWTPGSIG